MQSISACRSGSNQSGGGPRAQSQSDYLTQQQWERDYIADEEMLQAYLQATGANDAGDAAEEDNWGPRN